MSREKGDLSSVSTAEAETCWAHFILPYDVGPARAFLGEVLGPASRVKLYRVKLDCVPKDFVRRRFVQSFLRYSR